MAWVRLNNSKACTLQRSIISLKNRQTLWLNQWPTAKVTHFWLYIVIMLKCLLPAWTAYRRGTETRDATNFIFTFDNIWILTTFQLFDIRRIVGGISVKCEYFILCNLTEFNDKGYWLKRTQNTLNVSFS